MYQCCGLSSSALHSKPCCIFRPAPSLTGSNSVHASTQLECVHLNSPMSLTHECAHTCIYTCHSLNSCMHVCYPSCSLGSVGGAIIAAKRMELSKKGKHTDTHARAHPYMCTQNSSCTSFYLQFGWCWRCRHRTWN